MRRGFVCHFAELLRGESAKMLAGVLRRGAAAAGALAASRVSGAFPVNSAALGMMVSLRGVRRMMSDGPEDDPDQSLNELGRFAAEARMRRQALENR